LSQDAAKKHKRQQEEEERTKQQKRKTRNRKRRKGKGKEGRNRSTKQQTLSKAAEGSDPESKYDSKLSGVPPWENQHVCTNELIGQDLVGHENQERHPC
jgi:hypothetical protein